MEKQLEAYYKKYATILRHSKAETTVTPKAWVFNQWQIDTEVTSKKPEEAYAMLEKLKEEQPELHAVVFEGINFQMEKLRDQQEMQKQGANIIEMIACAKRQPLIPTQEALAQVEELLAAE